MSTCLKVVLLCALIVFTGCSDVSTGNQSLTNDRVGQIKKGVTTRAEVEQLLGPPTNVVIMGDGRRTMMYLGVQQHMNNAGLMALAVPAGGILFPANRSGSRRMERLQVILNKADIVEDYEFSDTTTDSKDTMMLGGGHVQESTTVNH